MSDKNEGFYRGAMDSWAAAAALSRLARDNDVTVSVTMEKGSVDPVIRCNVSDRTIQSILVPVTLARALEESILLTLPHVSQGQERHFVNGLVALVQEQMYNNVDKYLASKEASGNDKA